jgi:hypothetical protein
MPSIFRSGHGASSIESFNRLRINLFADVQQLQLRRYGLGLMAAGAGQPAAAVRVRLGIAHNPWSRFHLWRL